MDASQDIHALLQAFEVELPDGDAMLFPQQLGQFTCFGNLPVETHLQIWRSAFPALREVDLTGTCLFGSDRFESWAKSGPKHRGVDHRKFNQLQTEFPITLSVNQESRSETLKSYNVVFLRETLNDEGFQVCRCDLEMGQGCLMVPLWVSPDIDSVYLPAIRDDDTMQALLDCIENDSLNILSAIRKLEVRYYGFKMGSLQYFTALEHLSFLSDGVSSRQNVARENEKFLEELLPYLEEQVQSGLRANVPEIHFTDPPNNIMDPLDFFELQRASRAGQTSDAELSEEEEEDTEEGAVGGDDGLPAEDSDKSSQDEEKEAWSDGDEESADEYQE